MEDFIIILTKFLLIHSEKYFPPIPKPPIFQDFKYFIEVITIRC